MNHDTVAKGLLELSAYAEKIPGEVGVIASALLRFAAIIVRQGGNPVEHLSRLADLDPGFDAASKAADADATRKFHKDPQ